MKNVKNYLLVAIFSLISFIAGLTISTANASVNTGGYDGYSSGGPSVRAQSIYVEGQRYVVFTSNSPSIAVIRK